MNGIIHPFGLLLAGGRAACTPADSGDTGTTEEDSGMLDDGGFAGVTLPGTGDYAVADDAPLGGYELPDGCPDWAQFE